MNVHLVSIDSKEENEFAQMLCGYEACWIGLREVEHAENWFWPGGKQIGHKGEWSAYTNWNDGEPNNENADESVAFMNGWFRLDMPDPNEDAGDCTGPPRVAP